MNASAKFLSGFFAAVFVFTSGFSYAEEPSAQAHRYGLESGVVKYDITGAQTGNETVSFDQWGRRESRKTSVNGGKNKKGETFLTLFFPDFIYFVDLAKKSGHKWKNNFWDTFPEGEYTSEAIQKLGGKKTGTEDILGKTCDVWDIPAAQTHLWVWNRIPLKMTRQIQEGEIVSAASALQENVAVPEENFAVPEGADIKETGDQSIPSIT
ncbi:MAG TPA: hypothetical protein VL688_05005 [Verrucomicrobiae bacterium]|jgi:hypothetical protein|nr:hypothetical protein [Verrucomicrobiae bacterium]